MFRSLVRYLDRSSVATNVDSFLNPRCRPKSLDILGPRRSILLELRQLLPSFYGRLLDVGCGSMPYRNMIMGSAQSLTEYVGIDVSNNRYNKPNVVWDGLRMPISDQSIDVVLLTEVLE